MASYRKVTYKSKENVAHNLIPQAAVVADKADFKNKNVQTSKSTTQFNKDQHYEPPSPDDFMTFFPWACAELGSDSFIYIKRFEQIPYVSSAKMMPSKNKDKTATQLPTTASLTVRTDVKETKLSSKDESTFGENTDSYVVIEATYLTYDLTALRFSNNKRIPRVVFRILGLIIRFHTKLSNITINRGLDQFVIYEISKFLPMSHITELILDNCHVSQGNYNILLDEPSKLTYLSLARCRIGDQTLSLICEKLVYPKPASKTLTILNLSSNEITDKGARDVANFLRSNRRLRYINFCGNYLTDTGADMILSSLMEFRLTLEEYICYKHRYTEYLKTKNDLISRLIQDMKDSGQYESQKRGKMSSLIVSAQRKSKTHDISNMKTRDNFPDKETFYYRKALAMLPDQFGKFDDPFNEVDTNSKDGDLFSNGNGVLCYLNLAYNNLGELTAKKLVRTLKHQLSLNREQKGLSVVRLDGNPIPEKCEEMSELQALFNKTQSAVSEPKLKAPSKVKAKLPKK